MPPPSHRQLAAAVLIFHRPSRASPMHDARRSQPALVATDSLAHQHSTMVDKFPLVSAVQHSPSQSLDGPLGVRLSGCARALALRLLRLTTSRPGSSLRRQPSSQPLRNDPARAVTRIPSDLRSQLNTRFRTTARSWQPLHHVAPGARGGNRVYLGPKVPEPCP
ncbi:BZ3500_MvSof-1268-A1-R1_Chr2-1g04097 [Microbotryum saponariae]|uniref:BZ3500_MvSof-1268-A1-R1_Chr2-1g04097 protein n=1 Tax=Microbotryum saponariae TaxID=289078 RepID=A0A2X0MGG4_9BASI|nr:BZ3500_MvSof-1268-A1-R1_Chr2-1g04097 [Microbotryum saponariae]SCZ91084.1 BZ3501_MvSof-1269-A2-R1_Chr2-1g03753 [Microbotryum saponariae]